MILAAGSGFAAQAQEKVVQFTPSKQRNNHGFSKEANRLDHEGMALMEEGKIDEAVEKFNASLKRMPKNPRALGNRAVCRLSQGRFDEAIRDFSHALWLAPEARSRLGEKLGEAYLGRGREKAGAGDAGGARRDFLAALKCVDRVIALYPKHAQAYIDRAAIRRSLHQCPQARSDQDKALELSPNLRTVVGRTPPCED